MQELGKRGSGFPGKAFNKREGSRVGLVAQSQIFCDSVNLEGALTCAEHWNRERHGGEGAGSTVVSWFSLASFFFSGQLAIRSALDMSNKAGGKRSAATDRDLTNHSMVSEVPPERPGVRVSLADP